MLEAKKKNAKMKSESRSAAVAWHWMPEYIISIFVFFILYGVCLPVIRFDCFFPAPHVAGIQVCIMAWIVNILFGIIMTSRLVQKRQANVHTASARTRAFNGACVLWPAIRFVSWNVAYAVRARMCVCAAFSHKGRSKLP